MAGEGELQRGAAGGDGDFFGRGELGIPNQNIGFAVLTRDGDRLVGGCVGFVGKQTFIDRFIQLRARIVGKPAINRRVSTCAALFIYWNGFDRRFLF